MPTTLTPIQTPPQRPAPQGKPPVERLDPAGEAPAFERALRERTAAADRSAQEAQEPRTQPTDDGATDAQERPGSPEGERGEAAEGSVDRRDAASPDEQGEQGTKGDRAGEARSETEEGAAEAAEPESPSVGIAAASGQGKAVDGSGGTKGARSSDPSTDTGGRAEAALRDVAAPTKTTVNASEASVAKPPSNEASQPSRPPTPTEAVGVRAAEGPAEAGASAGQSVVKAAGEGEQSVERIVERRLGEGVAPERVKSADPEGQARPEPLTRAAGARTAEGAALASEQHAGGQDTGKDGGGDESRQREQRAQDAAARLRSVGETADRAEARQPLARAEASAPTSAPAPSGQQALQQNAPAQQGAPTQNAGGAQSGQGAQSAHQAETEARLFTSSAQRGLAAAVAQKGGSVVVRLSPESLGTMRIDLSIKQGMVAARFEAAGADARRLLNQHMDALKQTLESRGLGVERLTVSAPQPSSAGGGAQRNDAQGDQSGRQDHDAGDGRSRGGSDERGRREQDGEPEDLRTAFERMWRLSLDATG